MKPLFLLSLALLAITAHGGPRTSASYRVLTDGANGGGNRATSTDYTHDGSAGGITGISTVATPGETMKHGYIGQFTEVTALQITASPTTVNEGSTRQVSASVLNDDLTTTSLPAGDVSWAVQSGPLTGVDADGLATAAAVYQNTAVSVRGIYSSFTATGALTVRNVNTDDLPGYSGDGLDDAWQAQYFGLNNPLAAPNVITDGTGLTNLFKFTAGLIPKNSASSFFFNPQPVPGAPGQMRLVVNPRFPDRVYTVFTSPALGAGAVWTPLTTFTIDDNGNTRTITDTNATGTRKFYRVEITRP
ncbi:hypothetical protein [Prosthecobacter sp.]|uniref:hypothetical protein n=1 Tax=Prosthecobacter sp. TaxID=1965333 RepID=UPI0037841142